MDERDDQLQQHRHERAPRIDTGPPRDGRAVLDTSSGHGMKTADERNR